MGEFFRKMGRGVLFILFSAPAAVVIAFYLIYSLFLFVFMTLKSIPLFFRGGSILEPSAYDIEVEDKLLSEMQRKKGTETPAPAPAHTTILNVLIPGKDGIPQQSTVKIDTSGDVVRIEESSGHDSIPALDYTKEQSDE